MQFEKDGKEPLFVFRPRTCYLKNDHSQDIYADIVSIEPDCFHIEKSDGSKDILAKNEYELFNNCDVQYALVDVHCNQSRWLLVDTWKKGKGYQTTSYPGEKIQEAILDAKQRNEKTVHPSLEEYIDHVRDILIENKKYSS